MRVSPSVPQSPARLGNARRLLTTLALVLAGGLASAAAASAGPATPAEYTVNDTTDAALSNSAGRACVSTHGGSCTLRAAVQAADNTGGVSTITLPAGDYKLTIPSTTDDEPANGDLDIKGVSTAITLTGGGATSTIIDANHIDRAFAVQSGEGLTISGVTVRNGAQPNTAPSNESTSPGEGGAFVNEGSLTIEHSALSGNSAATAGGAVTAGPEATSTSIIDSTAEHNSSDGEGGVMRADSGNVTFTGDTVTHNTSKSDGAVLEYDKSGTAGAVTVTGSTISHNTADSDGGAFYVIEASSLTVSASTLDSNSTDDDYGGAIYAEGLASLTVEGSTLSSNSSGDTEGGAIYAYNDGTLAVSGSVFDGDSSGDGDGGAIAAEETNLTMSGSSFSGDQGEEGGAAYVDGTGPAALQSITTSTFADNEATSSEGGALYDEKGNLQLSDSTFNANNASDAGGALYYGSSDGLTVTNDTFDGNQTGEEGGAIDLNEPATTGEITLLNDTITRNQGYKGGGIYGPENANTIENTIVAGNSGGFTADGGGDCYGTQALDNATAADKGGNIDGDGACFSSLVSHDQTGVAPLLGELAANGGPTETDGLLTGSPAIASGVSTPVACPATDQRGATRSGGCYVGAFQGVLAENAGPPVVPSSPVVSGSPVLSAPTVITTTTTVTTQTASATPTECKSQRTETVNWKALAGVHFKDIVVMRGGKTYRDLPGSAREATVSLVGLPKGAVVVKVVGTTRSGERYTMARTYHLCVAARPGGKSASGVLTHA